MRTWLVLAPLLISVFALRPAQGPQEPAPPFTDERPFLAKAPSVKDVEALVAKARDGDKEALETLKGAGLTYAGYMVASPDRMLTEQGFALMREHLDWIEEMAGWEYTLLRPDSKRVLSEYQRLKDRFYSSDASLARALFHARICGDQDVYAKLLELAPDSPWAKAVNAYYIDGMEPLAAAEALIALAPSIGNLDRAAITLHPSQLRYSKASRLREETLRAEFELAKTPKALREILHVPQQWQSQRLYERIGVLLSEVTDTAARDGAAAQLIKGLEGRSDGPNNSTALALAAQFEHPEVFAKLTPKDWRRHATFSGGPMYIAYAAYGCDDLQAEERAIGAAICGITSPEVPLCQRFSLTQLNAWHDDMLALLSLRAALALSDDDLGGYKNVARALMRANRFPERAQKFRKALLATKNEALGTIAAIMEKGQWSDLNAIARGHLKLGVEARAALLEPFTYPEEITVHGGLQAVYYMNIAAFADAARAVSLAARSYWAALSISLKGWEKPHHPNLAEYALFLRRNCDAALRSQLNADLETWDKALAARVVPWVEAFDAAEDAEQQPLAVALQVMQRPGEVLSDSVAKRLAEGQDQFGGVGLACLARNAWVGRRGGERAALREKAERGSPVCLWTHLLQGPLQEDFGTSRLANWEVCSRAMLRTLLLQPCSIHSRNWAASLTMRTGQFGLSYSLAAQVAYARPATRMLGYAFEVDNPYQVAQARFPMRALLREAIYSADVLDARKFKLLVETLTQMVFGGPQGWERIAVSTYFGARLDFSVSVLEDTMASRNLEDVNNLLNIAFASARVDPANAIAMVEKAQKIGISPYGEFVGAQGVIEAHAALGTLEQALPLYNRIRAGKAGMPEYLDSFMLAGVLNANNHKQLKDAMDAIEKFKLSTSSNDFMFLWRRALMASGRHAELADTVLPEGEPHPVREGAWEYSNLFHEARALLDAGDFAALLQRTEPYLELKVEDGLGVYLDAALLRGIALKAKGREIWSDKGKRRLGVVTPEFCASFDPAGRFLDSDALSMLAGLSAAGALPERTQRHTWHGLVFGEHTPGFHGSCRGNGHEMNARDPFVRGALAWLAGDDKLAREQLKACVALEEKCCHEYHVAQWLLENPLKE